MDVNRDKVTALVFAHFVWIVAAALPYVTTPGTELFSFSALALIFGGMLVAGPLFGLGFHGVRSAIGHLWPRGRRTVPLPPDYHRWWACC